MMAFTQDQSMSASAEYAKRYGQLTVMHIEASVIATGMGDDERADLHLFAAVEASIRAFRHGRNAIELGVAGDC